MAVLNVKVYPDRDKYGEITGESISVLTPEGTAVRFSCYNLCECPEDAIIGRDLFDATDFISALELGMKLAKEGYTSIYATYMEDADAKE